MLPSWLGAPIASAVLCLLFLNPALAQSRGRGPRTGNWTSLRCTDPSVVNLRGLTPQERWNRLNCPNAWEDVINTWKTIDRPNGLRFTHSISDNLNTFDSANCGTLAPSSLCDVILCPSVIGPGSGAGSYLVWNSLVYIRELLEDIIQNLLHTATFWLYETQFAPAAANPAPEEEWLQFLLDLVGLGLAVAAGPVITNHIAKKQYFVYMSRTEAADKLVKDTSFALFAPLASAAKDLVNQKRIESTWTPSRPQGTLSGYLSQALTVWQVATGRALSKIFSGDDAAIEALSLLVSDGKWIEGWGKDSHGGFLPDNSNNQELSVGWTIPRAFFAYTIPATWAVSGIHPFVLVSGYPCGTVDPMGQYINSDTQHATWGCYQEKLYYLVAPIDKAQDSNNMFSAPPDLNSLDGANFKGISVQDFIEGALRTYMANGNQNGAPPMDPVSRETFEDIVDHDIKATGYIRLPVCSPEVALRGWDRGDAKAPNYPCLT